MTCWRFFIFGVCYSVLLLFLCLLLAPHTSQHAHIKKHTITSRTLRSCACAPCWSVVIGGVQVRTWEGRAAEDREDLSRLTPSGSVPHSPCVCALVCVHVSPTVLSFCHEVQDLLFRTASQWICAHSPEVKKRGWGRRRHRKKRSEEPRRKSDKRKKKQKSSRKPKKAEETRSLMSCTLFSER